MTTRRLTRVALVLGAIAGGFAALQVIPYGRSHDNPPVTQEPMWDSPRTRELAVRACFDCHSNETRWPDYASVAPMSWVVQHDVAMGREVMNFSTWNRRFDVASASASSVYTGNMPPVWYRMEHPDADLTDAEKAELARGLDATIAASNTVGMR
jgi:hypothetical protein